MSDNGKELTIDDILAANDVVIEKVHTPAWGGHCYVRTLISDGRDAFDIDSQGENLVGMRARLVSRCLCTKEGQFLNPSEAQVKAMSGRSAAMMDHVFEACQRINWMLPGDVEKLEKNSQAGASNGSG